jgi:hypothetical protein
MKKIPSEEYLDFLRKYREEEIKFLSENNLIFKYDTMQEYLEDKIKEYIQYDIDALFTHIEIQESFKGITLFNEKNLNL